MIATVSVEDQIGMALIGAVVGNALWITAVLWWMDKRER